MSPPPPRKAILLFIPGNPGLINYYTPFTSALRSQNPHLQIECSNYIGFKANEPRKPEPAITLPAQIAGVVSALDRLVAHMSMEERREVPIYVAGHSVGGYIALHVLAARPERVRRVYLITPTLSHIADSPNGRRMAPALGYPWFIAGVSLFASALTCVGSGEWIKWLLRTAMGQSREAADVTVEEFLHRTVVYSTLTLARSEMTLIDAPDVSFWRDFAGRCSAYWADADGWVSDSRRAELVGIAEGMESYYCPQATHAFCMKHGEVVAEVVGRWLDRDIEAYRKGI